MVTTAWSLTAAQRRALTLLAGPQRHTLLAGGSFTSTRRAPRTSRRSVRILACAAAAPSCPGTLPGIARGSAISSSRPCARLSLSLGGAAPSTAPDHARAGGHGAADSFLVLSGGGRRGRAMGSASPTAGLQQHGEGFLR